ncbi:MAG: hypothetical protein E6K07_07900 [Methanobacteriota archaeon]|nr:MAG: hypothetical protein E6K07_07900 [Euryarchaeota archaeon]TLZ90514.1 MAG: hypothetical protein E6K01_03455 [Euryarchaeota archaeon]
MGRRPGPRGRGPPPPRGTYGARRAPRSQRSVGPCDCSIARPRGGPVRRRRPASRTPANRARTENGTWTCSDR